MMAITVCRELLSSNFMRYMSTKLYKVVVTFICCGDTGVCDHSTESY